MCIVTTVCIVCADTHLNNISVTHIAVRYIAARLIVSDKISFCICTEASFRMTGRKLTSPQFSKMEKNTVLATTVPFH